MKTGTDSSITTRLQPARATLRLVSPPPLKARSSYPRPSYVQLGRGPLRRLAWIFGIRF